MTPDQIKAFLDDLARISLRHEVIVSGYSADYCFIPMPDGFEGYSCFSKGDCPRIDREGQIASLDISELSAHERFVIMGNRSPDLARMLRDAYLAGAVGDEDWCRETRPAFEREATEYAAKITGGQG